MIAAENGVHSPEQSSPEQCRGTLVDLDWMFERDGCVRHDENYNDCADQFLFLTLNPGFNVLGRCLGRQVTNATG